MAKDENPDEKKGKKQSGTSKVVFTKKLPAKIRDLISKLQQNYPFFAEMHEKEIEELLRQCENETFRDGEIIFEKGAGGDKFYLIVSGSVLIFPGNAEIRLEPGNVFGEMAILDRSERTATAMAASDATPLSLHQKVFSTEMLALRSKIAIGIAKQLSEKLRNTNQIMRQIADQLSGALKKIAEL